MQFLTEPEPARGEALPAEAGIIRILAPNPGVMTYWGTNTYVIGGPDGSLIVDPGPDDPAHVAAILHAAGARVAWILVTHTHQDHVGALPALRAATNAPVAAWHAPADPAIAPDRPLQQDDHVGPWRAIYTPGHASDHLCFLGPDGVLLSGDHVMGWSTTVIGPPGGNMADYFRSLQRLLDLDARVFLPGHGPALAAPRPFVEALLEHRRHRESAIYAALERSPASVRDLAAALYPETNGTLRRAAERNVNAHLQKMREEGRAVETALGWQPRRASEEISK
ncbi:MAG: MBL fold metallo-hydrolase [Acetobacteraceae bacterium]|nr:MBL fold metallo-hydrolase [Acetobacteraceae bacterium]